MMRVGQAAATPTSVPAPCPGDRHGMMSGAGRLWPGHVVRRTTPAGATRYP